jgi:uncharacterized membrane protein
MTKNTTELDRRSHRWPASLALLMCAGLYVVLPHGLSVAPKWLLPILIVLPLVPLSLRTHRHPDDAPWVRKLTIALIGLITVANGTSMVLLVHHLLVGKVTHGRELIYSAVSVWITNVIVFALWYWEIDRGGPSKRATPRQGPPDLQFPQMENPDLAPKDWYPSFWDYLYTAFTNGTSFAPADAMPLTLRLKVLFASESVISLVTIAIVAARAVNILH